MLIKTIRTAFNHCGVIIVQCAKINDDLADKHTHSQPPMASSGRSYGLRARNRPAVRADGAPDDSVVEALLFVGLKPKVLNKKERQAFGGQSQEYIGVRCVPLVMARRCDGATRRFRLRPSPFPPPARACAA
jgi:hypothetical protein